MNALGIHEKQWFLSPIGILMGIYLSAASLLVAGLTTSTGQTWFSNNVFEISISEAATVPGELYLAGFMGSLAFIWAHLVVGENDLDGNKNDDSPEVTTLNLYRMFMGLVGPLPLVFGIYVLAGVLSVPENVGLVGAAFLTGMFVRLIYRLFREFAHRLLPTAEPKPEGSDSTGNTQSTLSTSGDPSLSGVGDGVTSSPQ